jgi:hypothetical protein
MVGPCVGPSSSTYTYTSNTTPFSNNFEVEQTPLPPRDRRRIDVDPFMAWAGPVRAIAVRDGAYAPGERPPPVTLNTPFFFPSLPTATQSTYLLPPLLSSPSPSRISLENPNNYSPSFQEFPTPAIHPLSNFHSLHCQHSPFPKCRQVSIAST